MQDSRDATCGCDCKAQGWTKELPTENGYYWIKSYAEHMDEYIIEISDVIIDRNGFLGMYIFHYNHSEEGPLTPKDFTALEWCGPIVEPN